MHIIFIAFPLHSLIGELLTAVGISMLTLDYSTYGSLKCSSRISCILV